MIYRKLRRTWIHGYPTYMPEFRDKFPELKEIEEEDLVNRFIDLKMDFYYEEKTKVNPSIRLTLPFAILVILLMFLWLPFHFLLKGEWGYSPSKTLIKFNNWFRHLGIQL